MGKRSGMNNYIKNEVLIKCVDQRYRKMSEVSKKSKQISHDAMKEWADANKTEMILCERTSCTLCSANCGHLLVCYFPARCERVTHDNYDARVDAKSRRPA